MAGHERTGLTVEWCTPKSVFDALGVTFDLDVAAPEGRKTHVPCKQQLTKDSLTHPWHGFVWMNPPWGHLQPWIEKFIKHKNGIALLPARPERLWFQAGAAQVDEILFANGRFRYERVDGSIGDSPMVGSCFFGIGSKAIEAFNNAQSLGLRMRRV